MSTRGLWGYIAGGEPKLTYNHSDSYPESLGLGVLRHTVALNEDDNLLDDVLALQMVDEESKPTAEQKKALAAFTKNPNGYSDDELDWYWLLRGAQGEPNDMLRAGYMIDGADFANNSLFCEWGYVIDVDRRVLEVYEGFADLPHEKGRFAASFEPHRTHGYPPFFDGDDRPIDVCVRCGVKNTDEAAQEVCEANRYWPIKKIAEFSFDNLPTEEVFLKTVMKASRYDSDEGDE